MHSDTHVLYRARGNWGELQIFFAPATRTGFSRNLNI